MLQALILLKLLITEINGAAQLVVQDALEKIVLSDVIFSLLTPRTIDGIDLSLAGAARIIFCAPPIK